MSSEEEEDSRAVWQNRNMNWDQSFDSYEMPQAYEVPLADDCLYDSIREYVPQLAAYKQFAGKFSHLVDEDEEGDIA